MSSDDAKEIQLKTGELRARKIKRQNFKDLERSEIYVMLDRLNNGYNIGSILRLCDALLIKKLFIIEGRNPIARQALRSAKGAEKWVPFEIASSPASIIQDLKSKGVKVVAAEICHDSIDYREFDFSQSPLCFVFGSEGTGVSEEILKLSDYRIHLPVLGMCNSLNVSTCAAVCLFEAYKSQCAKGSTQ